MPSDNTEPFDNMTAFCINNNITIHYIVYTEEHTHLAEIKNIAEQTGMGCPYKNDEMTRRSYLFG